MKRRDLLKTAGTMMLTAPAVRASELIRANAQPAAQSQTKNLVVAFSGPFCFWQENGSIRVMAPPVGPTNPKVAHQPWTGTSANTTPINVTPGTTLTLVIDGYSPAPVTAQSGAPKFVYEQGSGTGVTPLFNLTVPNPNTMIGVGATGVKMVCKQGTPDPYCTQFMVLACGLSLLYQNVALDGVSIKIGSTEFFQPCFVNDTSLQDATLGIHLSPLERHLDPHHIHAKEVWSQMLDMYPWMKTEITGIDFCPDFDPTTCPPSCSLQGSHKTEEREALQRILVGHGGNCEAPIMVLNPGGAGGRVRK
jgi:hypothetical protein